MNTQKEESRALLEYMIHHNKHHMEELEELAQTLGAPSDALIRAGIADYALGNEKLSKAYDLLKEEA